MRAREAGLTKSRSAGRRWGNRRLIPRSGTTVRSHSRWPPHFLKLQMTLRNGLPGAGQKYARKGSTGPLDCKFGCRSKRAIN